MFQKRKWKQQEIRVAKHTKGHKTSENQKSHVSRKCKEVFVVVLKKKKQKISRVFFFLSILENSRMFFCYISGFFEVAVNESEKQPSDRVQVSIRTSQNIMEAPVWGKKYTMVLRRSAEVSLKPLAASVQKGEANRCCCNVITL